MVIGLVTKVGVANRHPVYNPPAVQTLPPDAAVSRTGFRREVDAGCLERPRVDRRRADQGDLR